MADDTPTRAHNEDGTFTADDPTTPDVNEAYVQTEEVVVKLTSKEKKAAAKAKKAEDAKAKEEPPARGYHPHTRGAPLNPGLEKKLALEARSKK